MDIFTDTPELMTLNDYHAERIKRRGLNDSTYTRTRSMEMLGEDLWIAVGAGLPVNADAVIALQNTVGPTPEHVGYVRQGDRYVRRNGIRCAALRIAGKVYEGERHSDIILTAIRSGAKIKHYPPRDDFGFVTDAGEFVNREEALKIALNAGQVEEGKTLSRDRLHSEDIL